MGGTQSTEGGGQYGFHVLKVKNNSPAFHAGIEQFFDYIVGVNGIKVDNGDSKALIDMIQASEDKPIPIDVYSSKDQSIRQLIITPSKSWHSGRDPAEKSLIGCSIRFCSYQRAGEHVWHILDVEPNSPAEMAGIMSHIDYIIGSPHMVLRSEDDFYTLVEEHVGKPLRLYVYNSEWDSCREVIIVPSHEWGGNGSLGCDVGYGLLHRIPKKAPHRTSMSLEQKRRSGSEQIISTTIFSSSELDTDSKSPLEAPTETFSYRLPVDGQQQVLKEREMGTLHSETNIPDHNGREYQPPIFFKGNTSLLQEAQDTVLSNYPARP